MMARHLTHQDLVDLSQVVASIFDLWHLGVEEQLRLLGFPQGTPATALTCLQGGAVFPDDGERLDRAEQILAIHESLRTAFPRSGVMAGYWLKQPHRRIGQRTPLAVMVEDGLPGLRQVRGLLDCTQNWI